MNEQWEQCEHDRIEEKFFSMAESSEKAIEDFKDFSDDRALVWAAREIAKLRADLAEAKKNSDRWKFLAGSPQIAYMLGANYDPNDRKITADDWRWVSASIVDRLMDGKGSEERG